MANTTVRADRVIQIYLDNMNVQEDLGLVSPAIDKVLANGKGIQKETGSHSYKWILRARRTSGGVIVAGQDLAFDASDPYTTLSLDFKNWAHRDVAFEIEEEQAHGKDAYDVLMHIVEGLLDDMRAAMASQFYADGDANNLDGVGTWDGYSGSLGQTSSLLTNSDTYAGSSTAYGAVEGTVSGDDGYQLTSPNIVDGTSSEFTGTTWEANAAEAMRACLLRCIERGANAGDMAFFLNRRDYGLFLNVADNSTQLVYQVNGPEVKKHALGFRAVSWDGVPVFMDGYNLTANNVAYLLNFSKKHGVGLISPAGGQTFKVRQGDSIDNLATKYVIRFHGNFITRRLDYQGAIVTSA